MSRRAKIDAERRLREEACLAFSDVRELSDAAGDKLNVESPERMMPTLKNTTGGAGRLYECTSGMGVAEGIDAAVAAHEYYRCPTWQRSLPGCWRPGSRQRTPGGR